MNKARRAKINSAIEQLERISGIVESIRDAEQDCYDSIPENLQGSERAELAEAAIDALDAAIDSIDEAVASLEEAAE